ncbi:mitochondrial large ribosomal subunit protein L16 [Lineolata rhizophorae]|uniref:Mitochondrial large ribosomal subunit protein L16 n=1 Tax=Lineolata rhizophorae TaxID=578093 RepID=A0A6A6P9E1_9PEZI|nr:mitochondrial large ribosomal subunit protein L16 [Lineolata rhizophorae]
MVCHPFHAKDAQWRFAMLQPLTPISVTRRPGCQSSPRSSISAPRLFSTTSPTRNWLVPPSGETKKSPKGRPRMRTGGSVKGTTVVWGQYGLRMVDKDRRLSAHHLRLGAETIKNKLRGMKYRLYHRVAAQIGVYTKGHEMRMGKGKGSFDYWAARVGVSKVIFELSGQVHEKVVRDAFRVAGNKMPGKYEFVKYGDPPVMGVTKLGNGVTAESLLRPRRQAPTNADRVPPNGPPVS